MEASREEILKALEQVIDPELKRSVVELDMVRDVRIDGDDVTVGIALTIAGCPLRASFEAQGPKPLVGAGAPGPPPRLGHRAHEGDRARPLDARPRSRERQGRRR